MSSEKVKNYFFPTPNSQNGRVQTGSDPKKNITSYISPVQFARLKQDVQSWREAIAEAEQAYYPHRVRMQRMFQDTILNEHIEACLVKRRRLTLHRDFKICDESGKEDDILKKYFTKTWFSNFQSYALDAKFFGYSLIALGDLVDDNFPDLSIVRRHNISPDRENVTAYVNAVSGAPFMEEPYARWHVWVPTPNEIGVSRCGYGLLYKIAKTEIYLRNNTAYNADAIQIFGQPIRKGKTTKTEESERAAFAQAMHNMGASAWILLDDGQDDLELIEAKSSSTGFQIYGDFEKRNEQKISKVLLGHADAMESVPGKLGSGQKEGGEDPIEKALNEVQQEDGVFLENVINNQLLPRMRKMGFRIPIEKMFKYQNNREVEEQRAKEDKSNLQTATIAQTMAAGGLKMDPKYFEERTGIPSQAIAEPTAPPTMPVKKELKPAIKNKLNKIYAKP